MLFAVLSVGLYLYQRPSISDENPGFYSPVKKTGSPLRVTSPNEAKYASIAWSRLYDGRGLDWPAPGEGWGGCTRFGSVGPAALIKANVIPTLFVGLAMVELNRAIYCWL